MYFKHRQADRPGGAGQSQAEHPTLSRRWTCSPQDSSAARGRWGPVCQYTAPPCCTGMTHQGDEAPALQVSFPQPTPQPWKEPESQPLPHPS